MRFSREFLDHDQGISAFCNPDKGREFMFGFNNVLSELRKQGDGLSAPERDALRHFATDWGASPAFVHWLVREHGSTDTRRPSFLPLHLLCKKAARWNW
jgi:hypothetical protein